METKNVINIKNLVKRFPVGKDYFTALQNVNLKLTEGEFIGLVGPSGSGKTTLFKALTGELQIQKGKVVIDGKDISKLSPQERVRAVISFVPMAFRRDGALSVSSATVS